MEKRVEGDQEKEEKRQEENEIQIEGSHDDMMIMWIMVTKVLIIISYHRVFLLYKN